MGGAVLADTLIKEEEIRTLLAAQNGEAALLWLCLRSGRSAEQSGLSPQAQALAEALLRQTGLLRERLPRSLSVEERPVFSEQDVSRKLASGDSDFRELVGDVQRRIGRVLSTEELKLLLGITDYLGMSREVVNMLLSYCIERSRSLGGVRLPSFRSIEKEAYHWADEGIDTMESAAAYVQLQLTRHQRVQAVAEALGLGGRKLLTAEERYILSWLDMGFGTDAVKLAYERTVMNTGALKWPYMNSILKSWHDQGLHSCAQIRSLDRKSPQKPGSQKLREHDDALSPLMKAAVEDLIGGND